MIFSELMRRRAVITTCAFLLSCLQPSLASSLPLSQLPPQGPGAGRPDEPITPVPVPPAIDPLKVELGERLFNDKRLSAENSRSCSSCHDINTNGASAKQRDVGRDGMELPFNTLTVFNSALNFRFGWEGKYRDMEADVTEALINPQIMGSNLADIAKMLDRDVDVRAGFIAAYGRRPDTDNVVDAIASFERTLLTPDSRFDRWLAGDSAALTVKELTGYGLFKSLGCVSCHQGVNVGGNLFEHHSVFHPLASPHPAILRVPSLRNVAMTPPYFHDGSAPTLDDAVRKMGFAQLDATLTDQQVTAIVAYLRTLTGRYRGATVRSQP